jgi:hypothetical protein
MTLVHHHRTKYPRGRKSGELQLVVSQGGSLNSKLKKCQVQPNDVTLTAPAFKASWKVIQCPRNTAIQSNRQSSIFDKNTHDTCHLSQSPTSNRRLISSRSNSNIISRCKDVERQSIQQSREGVERLCCTISIRIPNLALLSGRLQTHG